jgi:crotonobetainyl-CoA:carnitine CoA-transferase CaiB-like acyl-CoA transferase
MAISDAADRGPLHGVRIVDLTQMLAGPYATMLLADLGADVVKIEPLKGEFIRFAGPNVTGQVADGGYFQSVNRNKRSVCLDLKSPDGIKVLRELVRRSDVVVENFRVGVMDKLGIGYEQLKIDNPRLVYACIRGFGDPRTGVSPYVDWPAYDVVAQAMGGLMEVTGEPDGQPMKTGPGLGDIFPASLLTTGILAALVSARQTNQGRFVDVAMYDAMLSLCERLVYQHSIRGDSPSRQGNSHPFFEPFGTYQASDGWVAIAAPDEQYWRPLARVMQRSDLLTDPEFASSEDRSRNRTKVREIVGAWTQRHTTAEIAQLLGGVVPFGPVQNIAQIFDDPHVHARDMIWPLRHPANGQTVHVAGNPIKVAEFPPQAAVSAPTLGQHTTAVLTELGYPSEEIECLRQHRTVK